MPRGLETHALRQEEDILLVFPVYFQIVSLVSPYLVTESSTLEASCVNSLLFDPMASEHALTYAGSKRPATEPVNGSVLYFSFAKTIWQSHNNIRRWGVNDRSLQTRMALSLLSMAG